MTDYHFHHPEKMFTDRAELLEIIASQRLMTLAMAKDGQPYLITINYGFDAELSCFYFHCAPEGKKLDYLRANPNVWGQVVENRGYVTGKCDHAYRSVHFAGQVDFLETEDEKRAALTLMIRQMEPDPGPLEQRLSARPARQDGRRPRARAGHDGQTERAGVAVRSRYRQRRPEQLHAISAPECRVLLRHRVGFRHFAKERFHFAGRHKGDQHPAAYVSDEGPDMRHLAGREE